MMTSGAYFKRAMPAFSLVELLSAMAVLAMVLAILLQVVNGVLQSARMQSQQMESVGAARRALDIMAVDLSGAIIGESSAILASPANLALITDRRGTNISNHRFLAVTYSLNGTQLVRTYRSVSFNEADLLTAAQDTNGASVTSLTDGILGLNLRVITTSGPQATTNTDSANYATALYNGLAVPAGWKALITASPAFASSLTNRAQALEVWIAAVDEQNRRILEGAGNLATAQTALESNPTLWRSAIDSANIPLPAKSAIRILNKTIPLP
jgi:type II secretory pathway pseudopilin PulG